MEVMEAIKGRRSIRKFKPRPVEKALISTLLEAARWAPSWANTQCWRFIVVQDPEVKTRLAECCPSGKRWAATVKDAPVVLVACAELGRSGWYKGGPVTDKGDWFMFDTALACQNIMLVAHSLGLGTVPIGYFDAQSAAQILAVPKNTKVVLLLPVGWPDEQPEAPSRRQLDEIAFAERYGQHLDI